MPSSFDDALLRGARLFDAGAFFDAHEAWEERWLIEQDQESRRLLQGLIQIAAGFHKLFVAGTADSASRLLARGLAKLVACPTLVAARDLGGFRDGVRACAQELTPGTVEHSRARAHAAPRAWLRAQIPALCRQKAE